MSHPIMLGLKKYLELLTHCKHILKNNQVRTIYKVKTKAMFKQQNS